MKRSRDPLNKSISYMKTETERLEKTFDLVMLSDFYYESLVLLGQELCVQPEVLYVEECVNCLFLRTSSTKTAVILPIISPILK